MNKQEYLQKRDRLVSVLSKDGKYRIVLVRNTVAVESAQKRHHMDKISATYWAKCSLCSLLSASLLKGEERVTVLVKPDQCFETILAEACQTGEVRGYVQLKEDVKEDEIQKYADYLGTGIFRLEKVLYDRYAPVVGMIELVKGSIEDDYQSYLIHSEQIPSSVWFNVECNSEGTIVSSAGLLIQAMPMTTPEEIESLRNSLDIEKLIKLIHEEAPQTILEQILPFEFDIMNNTVIDFYCRCSAKKFMEKLIGFTVEEIQDMKAQNQRELTCHYCNTEYKLTDEDFDNIIKQIQNKEKKEEH